MGLCDIATILQEEGKSHRSLMCDRLPSRFFRWLEDNTTGRFMGTNSHADYGAELPLEFQKVHKEHQKAISLHLYCGIESYATIRNVFSVILS